MTQRITRRHIYRKLNAKGIDVSLYFRIKHICHTWKLIFTDTGEQLSIPIAKIPAVAVRRNVGTAGEQFLVKLADFNKDRPEIQSPMLKNLPENNEIDDYKKGVVFRGGQLFANPDNIPAAKAFITELRRLADEADAKADATTESKARLLRQNARAARRDADRIEATIPQKPLLPKTESEYPDEVGWEPGDIAIYTDFGLRSLYIVQILPWPKDQPDHFADKMGVVHHRALGSVRAKVIDTTLVDWDFQRPPRIGRWNEAGTIHYYHFTNLYRDIHDLIAYEAKTTYPHVQERIVHDLKAHPGWEVLKRFGCTGPETLKMGEKMVEVPVGKKAPYITITDPGKTTFNKGEVISSEAFAEENERVRKLGEKEATGWTGDAGEWAHDGEGGQFREPDLLPKAKDPDEPDCRPKREGDLQFLSDSPEFLANTIEQTGWREKLDKEFQLAITRTRK